MTMAMSHDACTHPRTPAGRAACRKARLANGTPNPIKKSPIPQRARQRENFEAAIAAEKAKRTKTARNPNGVGKASLADLPRVFRTVVEFATHEGHRHIVYTKGSQTMVDLVAPHGTLTLTWATSTPEGVHAVSWRPAGTSVARRVSTVNEGLVMLKGES